MRFSAGIFRAADYLRLSKEDGDSSFSPGKRESDSISSQRELIQGFVSQRPDIELVAEFVDDGFTGTNFDRPGFQKMMRPSSAGKSTASLSKTFPDLAGNTLTRAIISKRCFPGKASALSRSMSATTA